MQYKTKQFTEQLICRMTDRNMIKCGVTTYCKVKPNVPKDGILSDMYATALTE